MSERTEQLIELLKDKYQRDNQAFEAYLEGLVYNKYVHYWDYIGLDALLNLQNTRTDIPDEMIFIIYHQITELYFKLSLWELAQVKKEFEEGIHSKLKMRVDRINAYFQNLIASFEIMIQGMEQEQFLKFRMSLLPASGFQSAQYRMIELACTPVANLVQREQRESLKNVDFDQQYAAIYWRWGATQQSDGSKTLTLNNFESKYDKMLKDYALALSGKTISEISTSLAGQNLLDTDLKASLRELDACINVKWPLMHYKSAVRYLKSNDEDVAATGGTNWQQYLPPRHQLRIFFPNLFTEDEIINWGTSTIN
ncbi:MAG: tryptophan 2,3-dioxygenase family protein [Bacteroidota bacterium]|nr:tryptophan 2,3-dioxygenase family protein [Bacteroidota bacterium]